jgi:hypothetical protein
MVESSLCIQSPSSPKGFRPLLLVEECAFPPHQDSLAVRPLSSSSASADLGFIATIVCGNRFLMSITELHGRACLFAIYYGPQSVLSCTWIGNDHTLSVMITICVKGFDPMANPFWVIDLVIDGRNGRCSGWDLLPSVSSASAPLDVPIKMVFTMLTLFSSVVAFSIYGFDTANHQLGVVRDLQGWTQRNQSGLSQGAVSCHQM